MGSYVVRVSVYETLTGYNQKEAADKPLISRLVEQKEEAKMTKFRNHLKLFCFMAGGLLTLSGCGTKHYYNPNYPSAQQQYYFNRDSAKCSNYAQGPAPMPQVNYIDNGPKRTSGTFNFSDGRKNYNGNYNSYTYSTDYTASFVNGMSLGNALATPFRQENISNNCLTALGWYRIKHKYDVPPPEGNENLKTIINNLSQNGFVNTRYVNGVYYMIRSMNNEDDTIKMIIADIHQNGKTAGGKNFMYGIASWVIQDKKVAYISEYSAYDISNNRLLHEPARTKDFQVQIGSMLHVYMLDYDLI